MLPLGVAIEGLRLPVREALERAAGLGAEGVELSGRAAGLSPEALSQTGRRDLRHLVERLGLRLFALDGRLPGCVVSDPKRAQEAIDRTIPLLRLAADLRAPVVVTYAGLLGEAVEAPGWRTAREALDRLGEAADRLGAVLALTTGPESPSVTARLLDACSAGGLGAAYHPGLLVRAGADRVLDLADLGPRLVHAYAADAACGSDGAWRAARLGDGEVDWEAALGALAQVDYAGPLVIPRQGAQGTPDAVARAMAFIRRF